jgi:hypothetical protein
VSVVSFGFHVRNNTVKYQLVPTDVETGYFGDTTLIYKNILNGRKVEITAAQISTQKSICENHDRQQWAQSTHSRLRF